MQVMTQDRVGGKLFGVSCGFSGGQSERMAFYMPEAGAVLLILRGVDPRIGREVEQCKRNTCCEITLRLELACCGGSSVRMEW